MSSGRTKSENHSKRCLCQKLGDQTGMSESCMKFGLETQTTIKQNCAKCHAHKQNEICIDVFLPEEQSSKMTAKSRHVGETRRSKQHYLLLSFNEICPQLNNTKAEKGITYGDEPEYLPLTTFFSEMERLFKIDTMSRGRRRNKHEIEM